MKMTFRWYGEEDDNITLDDINQIPGVEGLVWALHHKLPGEVWRKEEIESVKKYVDGSNLHLDVVESVNVHEDIKLGLKTRDQYIENYIETIKNLHDFQVKVICYNFMPVFDWIRTDLRYPLTDGSTTLFYEKKKVEELSPVELVKKTFESSGSFKMAGWEPEKLKKINHYIEQYQSVTENDLWNNLKYFLEAIIPVAQKYDIKMAIHPDDPPWSIYGLPRIITNLENLKKYLSLVDSENNGLTFCTGSLGANPENDVVQMIEEVKSRIYFTHIRNLKIYDNGDFAETSHRGQDGSLDIVNVVKKLHMLNYTGYVRPDHGRHIWSEKNTCRPGYGLYDRALGVMYLWGIWDALK